MQVYSFCKFYTFSLHNQSLAYIYAYIFIQMLENRYYYAYIIFLLCWI